jgi:hypothetical protein
MRNDNTGMLPPGTTSNSTRSHSSGCFSTRGSVEYSVETPRNSLGTAFIRPRPGMVTSASFAANAELSAARTGAATLAAARNTGAPMSLRPGMVPTIHPSASAANANHASRRRRLLRVLRSGTNCARVAATAHSTVIIRRDLLPKRLSRTQTDRPRQSRRLVLIFGQRSPCSVANRLAPTRLAAPIFV